MWLSLVLVLAVTIRYKADGGVLAPPGGSDPGFTDPSLGGGQPPVDSGFGLDVGLGGADPGMGGLAGADPGMGGMLDPGMGGMPGADPGMGGQPGTDPGMGGMPGADPPGMGGMPGGDGMVGADPGMGGMPGADPAGVGGMPGGDGMVGADPGMGGMPGADPVGVGGMPGGDGMVGADPGMGGMPGADPSGMGGMPGGDGMAGADPGMGGMSGTDPSGLGGMPGGDGMVGVDPGMGGMPGADPGIGGRKPMDLGGLMGDKHIGDGLGQPAHGGPGDLGDPTGTEPAPAPVSPEQLKRNLACREKCRGDALCFIAHEVDCRLFIMCDRISIGNYFGTEKRCGHGTFWAGANRTLAKEETTCDRPSKVVCPSDPCHVPANDGGAYPHFDICNQYWKCENGVSVAMCCEGDLDYIIAKGTCEFGGLQPNRKCRRAACTSGPATCQSGTGSSEPMVGRHCGTFWYCQGDNPLPACCPPGERYNASSRECERNARYPCMLDCPPNYYDPYGAQKNLCEAGVENFKIQPHHCRTYMKCILDATTSQYTTERRCCKSGFIFDIKTKTCVESVGTQNCDNECPLEYAQDCPLLVNPNDPAGYIEEIHGNQKERPCPLGTIFSLEKCSCGTRVEVAGDNSCQLEIELQFHWPKYKNYGSESMVNIEPIGVPAGEGPILNKLPTYKFEGNSGYLIDFFKQSLPELFLQADFYPESAATGERMVLVSNCRQASSGLGGSGPSLEVTLENNHVVFRAVTPTGPAEEKLRFKVKQWNQFKAYYDGSTVVISIQDASMAKPRRKFAPLSGKINVAAEGLEIGTCKIREGRKGFRGFIAKVVASKCLKPKHRDEMVPEVGI